MPRPKQRTPELRDHVLSVALELLAKDGVAAFTTRTVANASHTSTPAIYELFKDKSGLVREMFFEGFRMLHRELRQATETDDPRADLVQLVGRYRRFLHRNPVLAEVMFSRPFTDFSPTTAELRPGGNVRTLIVARVRRCIDVGIIRDGDETDIAHVLVSLVQGLSSAESTRRLGTSHKSIERRWALAVNAVLDGLSP
jgi:AcrR family transcriptional regulator